MTRLRADGRRFRVRAAGVAIRDGRVLVCRAEHDNYWLLPGGGVDPHEASDCAVVREFREEIGADVRTGRCLWCVENFFTLDGAEHHEVGFVWEVLLPSDFAHFGPASFLGHDTLEGLRIASVWEWWPLDRLREIRLLPSFLADGLADPPLATQFLVHRDT